MKKPYVLIFLAAIIGLWMSSAVWADNVALNKVVTLHGTYSGGDPACVVDGYFPPRGTAWNVNSLYTNRSDRFEVSLTIDLGGVYTIDSLIVQGDDNDAFRLSYWDGSAWQTAWDVPNYDAYGWGQQCRPNPADTTEKFFLSAPITTNELMFKATSGDTGWSVSEIQAFGSPVPLPGAVWMFGYGLMRLVGLRRFRKS